MFKIDMQIIQINLTFFSETYSFENYVKRSNTSGPLTLSEALPVLAEMETKRGKQDSKRRWLWHGKKC